MKNFGWLVFGFGFLGSGFMVTLGVSLIAAPHKAWFIFRFIEGEKRFLRHADRIARISGTQNAITGYCSIGFGLLILWSLIRSLLYSYHRN